MKAYKDIEGVGKEIVRLRKRRGEDEVRERFSASVWMGEKDIVVIENVREWYWDTDRNRGEGIKTGLQWDWDI